jgi:hypothetical protein
VKFPDCDTPRITAFEILPAIGFGVPKSSAAAYRKNEPTSRNARGAGAEDVGILDLVDQLIQQCRIEAVLQADMHGKLPESRGIQVLRSAREAGAPPVLQRAKAQSVAGIVAPS